MDLKTVSNQYSISFANINPINKGYACEKWLLYTDNDECYILKKVNHQDEKRIQFSLMVQSLLKTIAVPVIKTINGDLYFKYKDGFYYLSQYISKAKRNTNSYELGKLLGITHSNMSKIKMPKCDLISIDNNYNNLIEYLDFYKKAHEKQYIKIIDYKLNIIKNYKCSINKSNLSRQIIHGDFYTDNVIKKNKNNYLIDFDQCCTFYKEYEVMRALIMTSVENSKMKRKVYKRIKKFLKGYFEENTINSIKDSYNLYLLIQANSLSCLDPKNYGDKNKKKFAKKRYKILKFLFENKDYIVNVIEENKK